MFMTNQQTAKLAEPGVGSLHDPAALITPQFAPILVAPFLIVLPVRRNQFNASLLQSLPQRVRIVAAVGDYAFRLLSRPACRARYADFGERGFRKLNFCRRGTFQPNSQRKTLTVDQCAISSHCSSVNSFCRVLMTEAHQLTCLTHKYLS